MCAAIRERVQMGVDLPSSKSTPKYREMVARRGWTVCTHLIPPFPIKIGKNGKCILTVELNNEVQRSLVLWVGKHVDHDTPHISIKLIDEQPVLYLCDANGEEIILDAKPWIRTPGVLKKLPNKAAKQVNNTHNESLYLLVLEEAKNLSK